MTSIPRRCAVLAFGLTALLLPPSTLSGAWQDQSVESTRQFDAVALRHRRASDVERLLSDLLTEESTARIVADEAGQQVLVWGSSAERAEIRRWISRIDVPLTEATAPRPEIRMYRAPVHLLEPLAVELRSWPEGIKASVSANEGILLVLADPQAHERIATWIDQQIQTASLPATRPSTAPTQPAATPQVARPESHRERFDATDASNTVVDEAPTFVRRWLTLRRTESHEPLHDLAQLFPGRVQWDSAQQDAGRIALRSGDRLTFRRESNESVAIAGPQPAVDQLLSLVTAMYAAPDGETVSRVLVLQRENQAKVRALLPDGASPSGSLDRNSRSVHQANRLDEAMPPRDTPSSRPPTRYVRPAAFLQDVLNPTGEAPVPQDENDPRPLDQFGGVQIDTLPDLDVIILRGRDEELQQLSEIIRELERIGRETQAAVEVVHLQNVDSERMAELVEEVREDLVEGRAGRASLIPLESPNALLMIGWGDAVATLTDLVRRLDVPTDPLVEFEVFPIRHASAEEIADTIQDFFSDRNGLGPNPKVSVDARTNSVVVHAAPRDLNEVRVLIARLDVPQGERTRRVRVFQIEHSIATDIAQTLQDALDSASSNGGPAALELLTTDGVQRELLRSGILEDVQVTTDPRNNQVIVTGPIESFELIEALIRQLDAPGMVVKIKIFPVVNGDAGAMVQTLRALIPSQTGTQIGPRLSSEPGETSLSPLRFTVDARSNSVIATGSEGDLRIVEALILRLDEGDAMQRRTAVYQLKNAPAVDVALSVNEFLRSRRQVENAAPGQANPFQQLEREVVVVPEPVANKLILSATPRYFEEIEQLIEKLDDQPPQVMIQVLIAEVTLGDADEFGVELGIQDSVLFDRSLLGDLVTTDTTTQVSTPAGVTTTNSQTIQAASNIPGFDFNNTTSLGNSGSQAALGSASLIGGQGLSNFAVGRGNGELGFGGLVLSASSQNVSILLRSLQETRRMEVLSRPQVRTLDNQPAFIQIGQRVPRIAESTTNQNGQSNSVLLENVGLILAVTPRIGPDGTVVMEIDAEKSSLGPELEGVPVSVSVDGTIIRAPRIDTTTAQATVSAADGETIILGGLITKSNAEIHRKVPFLGDLPIVNRLFRFDSVVQKRTELLIILTPRVIRNSGDEELLKQTEFARMSWCAADVFDIHGDIHYLLPNDVIMESGENVDVIFPAEDPRGLSSRRRVGTGVESLPGSPTILPQPMQNQFPGPSSPPMVPPQSGYGPNFPTGVPANLYPPSGLGYGVQPVDYQAPVQPYSAGPFGAAPFGAEQYPSSAPMPGYDTTQPPQPGYPMSGDSLPVSPYGTERPSGLIYDSQFAPANWQESPTSAGEYPRAQRIPVQYEPGYRP